MVHDLKIREEFAEAIAAGEKTFEIRFNDRGYQKGDTVCFLVVDENGIHQYHPIEEEVFEITYVLNGWGLENGYVVFGIRREEAGDAAD